VSIELLIVCLCLTAKKLEAPGKAIIAITTATRIWAIPTIICAVVGVRLNVEITSSKFVLKIEVIMRNIVKIAMGIPIVLSTLGDLIILL
jgi:hypothetical protein